MKTVKGKRPFVPSMESSITPQKTLTESYIAKSLSSTVSESVKIYDSLDAEGLNALITNVPVCDLAKLETDSNPVISLSRSNSEVLKPSAEKGENMQAYTNEQIPTALETNSQASSASSRKEYSVKIPSRPPSAALPVLNRSSRDEFGSEGPEEKQPSKHQSSSKPRSRVSSVSSKPRSRAPSSAESKLRSRSSSISSHPRSRAASVSSAAQIPRYAATSSVPSLPPLVHSTSDHVDTKGSGSTQSVARSSRGRSRSTSGSTRRSMDKNTSSSSSFSVKDKLESSRSIETGSPASFYADEDDLEGSISVGNSESVGESQSLDGRQEASSSSMSQSESESGGSESKGGTSSVSGQTPSSYSKSTTTATSYTTGTSSYVSYLTGTSEASKTSSYLKSSSGSSRGKMAEIRSESEESVENVDME